MTTQQETPSRSSSYVDYIIRRCQQDNGVAAMMRRADNPDTEYQSWEILAGFSIDIEKTYERLPYATIGSAIAKAKVEQNGVTGLGRAIASCYDEGSDSQQAKAKLRRVLACKTVEEVCRVIRPLFSLINSKSALMLDYARLLEQLLKFHWQPEKVREQWAGDFYRQPMKQSGQNEVSE